MHPTAFFVHCSLSSLWLLTMHLLLHLLLLWFLGWLPVFLQFHFCLLFCLKMFAHFSCISCTSDTMHCYLLYMKVTLIVTLNVYLLCPWIYFFISKLCYTIYGTHLGACLYDYVHEAICNICDDNDWLIIYMTDVKFVHQCRCASI